MLIRTSKEKIMERHYPEKHPSTVIGHAGKIEEIDAPSRCNSCCCGGSCDVCGGSNCLDCPHPTD